MLFPHTIITGTNGTCGSAFYTCLPTICTNVGAESSIAALKVLAIDTAAEARMGLGRDWPYAAAGAVPPGQLLLGADAADTLGARAGDTVMLELNDVAASPLLRQYLTLALMRRTDQTDINKYLPSNASLVWDAAITSRGAALAVPFKVAAVVDSFKNKFASGDKSNLAVVELTGLLGHIATHLHPALSLRDIEELALASVPVYDTDDLPYKVLPWSPAEVILNAATDAAAVDPAAVRLGIEEFATEIPVNLAPERVVEYLTDNYDLLQQRVITFATQTLFIAGFTEVEVETPILDELRPLRFFSLFLGLILSIILTILFVLSFMLIYSLLMISVETRTFELGVHRMTGLTRVGVINMLLVQALSYAIPSWAVGLLLSQILTVVVVNMLSTSVEVPMANTLTPLSIGIATVLGICIPLVAAILPIRDALSKNLHDTLDTRHSKTLGVSFNIERSDDGSISATALVVGVGLVVFGFLIYYLLPLSLLSLNLTLFFNIFFGILVGLLFGLIMLSLNFEHLVERLVVSLFFFWELRSIPQMVLKNLVAHRLRNRKTTIMYALSLGFVIFVTVAYTTELESAKATSIKSEGAPLTLSARGSGSISYGSAGRVEALLTAHTETVVADWAWVSRDINFANQFSDVATSNLGHYYEHGVSVHAVSPSFFNIGYSAYLVAPMEDRSTSLSISEQLYTVRGGQSLGLSQGIAYQLNLRSLRSDSTFLLNFQNTDTSSLAQQKVKPLATMSSGSGLEFKGGTQSANFPIVMSVPAYLEASNGAFSTIEDIPWEKVMITLRGSASASEVAQFKRLLKREASSINAAYFDASDISETLDSTRAMLDLIFSIATYIAMFLCLFSLIASMYSNIYESAKEIGVMRAIGLTTFQVTRIFVYEAFTLVLASSLLGIIIGFIMGWTMLLQRVLFVNLPIPFIFPWSNLILVFVAAILCSFLASWGPIKAITRKTISAAFRTIM